MTSFVGILCIILYGFIVLLHVDSTVEPRNNVVLVYRLDQYCLYNLLWAWIRKMAPVLAVESVNAHMILHVLISRSVVVNRRPV